VGSLWKAAIVTNISFDGEHFAFQISKILTTTAIDIILQEGPQKSFKKLMSGEFGVLDHLTSSRKRHGLEIHYRRFWSNTNIKVSVVYLHLHLSK
jgi:hypothetical protein